MAHSDVAAAGTPRPHIPSPRPDRVTAVSLQQLKKSGERIAALTAYDFPSACLMDDCGIDLVLVGDSCAMAVMGHDTTLRITLDEMLHHVKMVSRGVDRAMVVADMPYLSYQVSVEEAVRNAGRLVAEGGAQAVKLEGPVSHFGDEIRAIQRAGIPVMGHIGLTPQSVHVFGGYPLQGRDAIDRDRLKREARDLEQIGCFALVLEKIPAGLAAEITSLISIPTIGIGAGSGCDGQILVMHDMLGLGLKTRFSKVFGDVRSVMESAFRDYVEEVRSGVFPDEDHAYK